MNEMRYAMWVVYGYAIWIAAEYAWDWWKKSRHKDDLQPAPEQQPAEQTRELAVPWAETPPAQVAVSSPAQAA